MTGESIPIAKSKGSKVLAGTFLQQGSLTIRVIASLEQSALQKIIQMITQEIKHKSKYVREADLIVKWFVPLVITLAIIIGIACYVLGIMDGELTPFQTGMMRAISILLISCPCAIGIAAPLAESYLLNGFAKLGILVRNRGCLPFLGKETVFIFDKTGTVTEGRFVVHSGLEALSFKEQMVLKGLVEHSIHPIAIAISASLLCPAHPIEKVEENVGKGMHGFVENVPYFLGSLHFLSENGVAVKPSVIDNHSILTTIYFAKEKGCLTAIHLGDQLKEGICACIGELSNLKTLLISGDNETVVAKVAKMCGIKEWKSNCLPLQKKILIDMLKDRGEIIAMVGDGMNDALALTAAHIGIAVLSATDISIQVSDLLNLN